MRDPLLRRALRNAAVTVAFWAVAYACWGLLFGWEAAAEFLQGILIGAALSIPIGWAAYRLLGRRPRRRSSSDPIGEAMAEAAALQDSPHARRERMDLNLGAMPLMLYTPDGHLYSPGPDGKLKRVTVFGVGSGPGLSVDDLLGLEPGDMVEVDADDEVWRVIRHRYCWWRIWSPCRHAVLAERAIL